MGEGDKGESKGGRAVEECSKKCNVACFEDVERRPIAKERGKPLKKKKGKETDSLLEPSEQNAVLLIAYLDF